MVKVRHIGIVVLDMKACVQFYCRFGFLVAKAAVESGEFTDTTFALLGTKVTTVKLTKNGCMIELLSFEFPPYAIPKRRELFDIGISHIALTVDDIDSEYKRLTTTGIHFRSEPTTSPDGKVKAAFCRDPEGNTLELVQEL